MEKNLLPINNNMTKSFDEICKNILGEMISPNTTSQPAANTGSQAAVQNNAQQKQSTQQGDQDLLKFFQQLQQTITTNPNLKKEIEDLMKKQTPPKQPAAQQPVTNTTQPAAQSNVPK